MVLYNPAHLAGHGLLLHLAGLDLLAGLVNLLNLHNLLVLAVLEDLVGLDRKQSMHRAGLEVLVVLAGLEVHLHRCCPIGLPDLPDLVDQAVQVDLEDLEDLRLAVLAENLFFHLTITPHHYNYYTP